jgi:malate dehydrogenase
MEFQCLNFFQRGVGKVAADTGGWCNSYGALGTSAWYAPGASVAYLVDSILNQKKMIACSVFC